MAAVMNLKDLQLRFKSAMLEEQTAWEPMALGLCDSPPVPFQTRVRIYHYAFSARIGESLIEDFPSVVAWVGEEALNLRVREFLRAFPSDHRKIGDISRYFPAFLKRFPGEGSFEFLADLATLDWAETFATFTDIRPPPSVLPLSKLAEYPLQEISLVMNPSLYLMTSEWPVDKLRKPRKKEKQRVYLAVYRRGEELFVDRLRKKQWEILEKLQQQFSVLDLLAWLQGQGATDASIQKMFENFAERFLIQGFRRQI